MHAEYAPELDVRALGASGPATMWLELWKRSISLDRPHIAYHAMLIYAWSIYYRYDGPSPWTSAVADRIDDVMSSACSFDFNGTRETYRERLGDRASNVFASDFLDAYRSGNLEDYATAFSDAFAANRIGPYEQTAPLTIWQGGGDQTVPEQDTARVVAALREGGVDVDYRVVSGADDLEVAFGFVSQHQAATEDSLQWIFEQLEN